jgi:hypothetical protein
VIFSLFLSCSLDENLIGSAFGLQSSRCYPQYIVVECIVIRFILTSGACWLGALIVVVCPTCRAPSCFELSWPWRLESGFFLKPKKDIDTDDDNVRKYLLSFRSLNRKYLWQCSFKCLLVGSAEVPAEIALSHVLKIC